MDALALAGIVFLGTLGMGACSPGGDRAQPGRAATEVEVPAPPAVEEVPEDLRPLVPLALQWGIGDDLLRNDVVNRASAAEKRALLGAFGPHLARINAWLDSFCDRPMTEEATAFMYMRLTLDEMDFDRHFTWP